MEQVLAFLSQKDLLFSDNALLVFGVASGLLSTLAFIPYIFDTIVGRTQPQRASWLIWSVLGSIAFCSQVYEGATSSLWFAGVQVTGTIVVFLLSIRSGAGAFLSRTDNLILAAAAGGLVLWYFTETAAYALAITISISLLGGLATVIKAYKDPDSETLVTWVVSLVASACAVMSVGRFDPVILAYPLYLLTLYTLFVAAILLGRIRKTIRNTTVVTVAARTIVSFSMLRSGLRTTADAAIVCVALLFSFHWLSSTDAISSGRLNTADHQPQLFDIKTSGMFEGVARNAVNTDLDVLTVDGFEQATPIFDQDVPNTLDKEVILIALLAEPDSLSRHLTDKDALANEIISKIKHHLNASESGEPSAAETLEVSDLQWINLRDHSQQAVASLATEHSNLKTIQPLPSYTEHQLLPTDIVDFQRLDDTDPFTTLLINSDNANLIHEAENSSAATYKPKSGDYVKALAVHGDWFKVRTPTGQQGYIHRSFVEIEMQSLLLNKS